MCSIGILPEEQDTRQRVRVSVELTAPQGVPFPGENRRRVINYEKVVAAIRTIAESARRAILITQSELGRLPIPADKYNPTIVVRWPMKLICEQRGGC